MRRAPLLHAGLVTQQYGLWVESGACTPSSNIPLPAICEQSSLPSQPLIVPGSKETAHPAVRVSG